MGPNLVGPPGNQLHLQQSEPSADGKGFIARFYRLCRWARPRDNPDNASLSVLGQISSQYTRGWIWPPKGYAEVFFLQFPAADQIGEKHFRPICARQQHKTAGAGIQPVAEP